MSLYLTLSIQTDIYFLLLWVDIVTEIETRRRGSDAGECDQWGRENLQQIISLL